MICDDFTPERQLLAVNVSRQIQNIIVRKLKGCSFCKRPWRTVFQAKGHNTFASAKARQFAFPEDTSLQQEKQTEV